MPTATETAPSSPWHPRRVRSENRIGRYVLLDQLGEGGIGVVIKAYDPKLDRAIALKLLHRSKLDDGARMRFEREAQAIARLRHSNVVTVFDVGEHEGEPYLAMELIRGGSLADWLGAERRDAADILRVFRQAAQGLIAAHDEGIVHRDFKPANVLIDDDGSVRVADFGLARVVGSVDTESDPDSPALSLEVTQTGAVVGTPAYMAPEQVAGAAVDARADQFSFCVSLYEALVGARPNLNDGLVFPPGSVPRRVQRALRRGLAASPGDRFSSMRDLVAQLRPRARRKPALVALAGGIAAVAFVLAPRHDAVDPCAGLGAPVEHLWTAETRGAITETFASGHPDGRLIALHLSELVDERLDKWTRERTAACVATSRGEQSASLLDRRMLCYDRQLTVFQAFSEAWLSEPDHAAIDNAVPRFSRAFDLSQCSAQALLTAPDRPTTPGAKHVMELVDRSRALRLMRNRDEALPLADQAVAEARTLGHDGMVAEALYQRAQALQDVQRFDDALDSLHEGAAAAGRSRYRRLLAIIIGDMSFSLAEDLGRVDDALLLGRLAAAMALELPDDLELQGRIAADLGIALQRASQLDESERYLRIALEAQRRLDRPYDLFQAMSSLANTLRDRGRLSEAAPLFEEAVALIERLDGRSTRETRLALANLATVYIDRGDNREAIELLHRIESEGLAADGPSSRNLVYSYANLATAYLAEEDNPKALVYANKVIELFDSIGQPTHYAVAYGCFGAAEAHLALGQPADALERLDRAELILRDAMPGPTQELAHVIALRAEAYRQQGDLRRARATFESSLAMHDQRGSKPWERVAARFGLARTLWALGDRDGALALARSAAEDLRHTEMALQPTRRHLAAWLAERT